jgi:4-amino-4-deoxy-L-arabinose transferase-like glycosyltransferase
MLDHEAMLSLFVMISVFALAIYLSQERRIGFLVVSGIAAGLAQLTKSSALAILAPAGILFLAQIYNERGNGISKAFINNAKIFALWFLSLAIAYFIFWPGMWVAPQKMLYEVYGNAFSYAFQGGRLTVTGELDSSQFSLNFNSAGILSLAGMFLRRTTLLTWIGILLGFALPFIREEDWAGARRNLFTMLWVTAAAFIIMFGVAQGRNSPHYILCSYLALNLLAGLGWFYVVKRFSNRPAFQSAAFLLVLLLQLWSAVSFFPYYYTYENPILSSQRRNTGAPLFPYGEGLELAGKYLATLPNAKDSTALVYFSRGCFSYFYPGTTQGFKNYYADGAHPEELLYAINSADYLVVYYALQGHLSKYKGYIEALSSVKPIHEVWLDGRKYVIIYKVDQIPESVRETLKNLKPSE